MRVHSSVLLADAIPGEWLRIKELSTGVHNEAVQERLSDVKLASSLQEFQSHTSSLPAFVTCSPIVAWFFGFSLLSTFLLGDQPRFELGLVSD